jgi:uncharacterized membrane protein
MSLKSLTSFHSERGSISILSSLMMVIVIGFSALAVDVSNFYYQRRTLRTATDLAAMAAAMNLSDATAAAQATLALNGFPASTLQSVTIGTYTANASTPVAQRFVAGSGATANAVLLSTQTQAQLFFGGIFQILGGSQPSSTQSQGMPIAAQATAAINPTGSFAIGSGLVGLQNGILNSVLGAMLGSNLSLSLADYQSLASANIDLFAFSNALASRANITGVTYTQLLSGTFSESDVLYALEAAAASSGGASSASSSLSSIAAVAPTTQISLSSLMSLGAYGSDLVGSTAPITTSVSALDVLSNVLQIANGTNQVQVPLSVNLSPVASATLQVAQGQRPSGSTFATIGSAGATVYTTQTRLLLTLNIAQSGTSSLLSVPIYIELGAAKAQLTSATCSTSDSVPDVTLAVTPSLVNAWIGKVTNADFTNFATEPVPTAATLLSVPGIATVTGLANASIANTTPTSVSFTYTQIQNATRQTTSTTDYVSSLLGSLLANLQLNASVIGLGLGLPSVLDAAVAATLATATSPIDTVLSSILQGLGLGVGQAYTWVSGVNCHVALVN